jgi:hypothetical protein
MRSWTWVASRGNVRTGHRGIRWEKLSLDNKPDLGIMVKDRIAGLGQRLVDLEHAMHWSDLNQNSKLVAMLRADLEEVVKKLSNLDAGDGATMDGIVMQQIEFLQQRLRDIEAKGGEQGFILNEHSFLSFVELKD